MREPELLALTAPHMQDAVVDHEQNGVIRMKMMNPVRWNLGLGSSMRGKGRLRLAWLCLLEDDSVVLITRRSHCPTDSFV